MSPPRKDDRHSSGPDHQPALTDPADPGSAASSLSSLLLRWEQERAQGRELSAEQLCGNCPALRPEVERRIAALRAVYQALDTDSPLTCDRTEDDVPTVPGYEILSVLGRGGMGTVYKARHLGHNRVVALKMIGHAGRIPADDRARFQREAEAIARLRHPNIVQIIEVGQQAEWPYLALEYCPGGSLAQKLNGTPLSPGRAARLVEVLARAVAAAHEQHLIHRDLKPANVLLRQDGTPVITDFGLAKQLDRSQGLTPTVLVMGTPSYMAPEQASGKTRQVGPAADIYALGAILYECLTGRPPFRAVTPADTVLQVLHHKPVRPSLLQPGMPRAVEAICLRCLDKQPRRRYPNALALAEDLARFSSGQPTSVGSRSRPVHWWRWLCGHPGSLRIIGRFWCILSGWQLLSA